jgi:hypothetical protein
MVDNTYPVGERFLACSEHDGVEFSTITKFEGNRVNNNYNTLWYTPSVPHGIFHIVASNDPSLTDIPKIGEIKEDIDSHTFIYNGKYLSDVAIETVKKECPNIASGEIFDYLRGLYKLGFKDGYKAASKKQFTEEDINSVLEAWDSLPGGKRYSREDIEKWLLNKMAPAIRALRNLTTKPLPKQIEIEVKRQKFNDEFGSVSISDIHSPKVDDKGFVIIKSVKYE